MSDNDSAEWAIVVTRNAEKSLVRLDRRTQQRLREAIDNLMDGDIKKLAGRENQYRIRVGDYRVVFSPDYSARILTIIEIFPRSRGYR